MGFFIVYCYIDYNIYMQDETFQHRLVCKVHSPCFAEDRGLILMLDSARWLKISSHTHILDY